MRKDDIYSLPLSQVGDFQFDERVVRVFPDMIKRSVPGYGSILSMIGELAERYVTPGSTVYDLGCSLGACTLTVGHRVPTDCLIRAIDSSESMVSELQARLGQDPPPCRVEVECADLREVAVRDCSLAILNFTLQFIPQAQRNSVLQTIAQGTLPGGALVLSEKIAFQDPQQQELLTELHHNFKRAHGYSDLEIAQKRTALENTLIPETLECHLERLKTVGFETATCWFQCFNFVSILALKS